MKKKVCPYCDQQIDGMYCRGCRRLVWKPMEREMGYYLNERHPENEKNCLYHKEESSGIDYEQKKEEIRQRMAARQQERQKDRKQEQTVLLRNRTGHVDHRHHPEKIAAGNLAGTKKKSSTGALIWTVTGLVVCMMLMTTGLFLGVFGNYMNRQIRELAVPDSLTIQEEEGIFDEWERTDEEVKEAGIRCNGYGHFPVVYEDMETILIETAGEVGFGEVETEQYSYNQVMDSYTWFCTTYELALYQNDDYQGTMEVDTDTVTGELHSIAIYTMEESAFYRMADLTVNVMEKTGICTDLPDGETFYKEALEGPGQEMEGFNIMYDLEVSCYLPENQEEQDFFKMTVYAPGYYTMTEN